ncbi:MAG TPA: phosphoribosylanthranilate isomerase [bacterium]|nr:phosphoribosylanthranilate isomerase [bacterium]HPN42393.1 phosphoribosylanthranilate isomerase [bacterium]
MWVKICGITRLEDALFAEALGADAIGFVFAASPRQMTPTAVAEIGKQIHIPKIGVFVDAGLATVQTIRRQCGLDIVQLHGNESPDYCRELGGAIIKAFRMQNAADWQKTLGYTTVWKILVDAFVPGVAGGTGRQIDAAILQNADLSNIILAGGITPGNAADYMTRYKPFGLDVSSGVEDAPGFKNKTLMTNLIRTIKR